MSVSVKKVHKLFMARWTYFDTDVFHAAYVSHPEFLQVQQSGTDEAAFRRILKSMATEEHSFNAMMRQWAQLKTAISTDDYGLIHDEAFSAEQQKLQPFEWVRAHLVPLG